MSHRVDSAFTKYKFTEEEELQAYLLNDLQLQMLQTELAVAAETRVALDFDVEKPAKFAQDEAFNKGKIQFIEYLLQCHTDSIERLKARALQNQDSNPNPNPQ